MQANFGNLIHKRYFYRLATNILDCTTMDVELIHSGPCQEQLRNISLHKSRKKQKKIKNTTTKNHVKRQITSTEITSKEAEVKYGVLME